MTKASALRTLGAALVLVAASGCFRIPIASLTALSLQPAAGATVLRESVTGRACRTSILNPFRSASPPVYERAVEDALAQVPGADALADATLYAEFRFYLFADVACTRVDAKAISTGGSAGTPAAKSGTQ